MASINELLQEAERLGLSKEDVILALQRVIEHNERCRHKRVATQRRQHTTISLPRRNRRKVPT